MFYAAAVYMESEFCEENDHLLYGLILDPGSPEHMAGVRKSEELHILINTCRHFRIDQRYDPVALSMHQKNRPFVFPDPVKPVLNGESVFDENASQRNRRFFRAELIRQIMRVELSAKSSASSGIMLADANLPRLCPSPVLNMGINVSTCPGNGTA